MCYYLTLEITGESLHKMYGLISHRFRPGMVCTHFSATVLYRHRERGGGGALSAGVFTVTRQDNSLIILLMQMINIHLKKYIY